MVCHDEQTNMKLIDDNYMRDDRYQSQSQTNKSCHTAVKNIT